MAKLSSEGRSEPVTLLSITGRSRPSADITIPFYYATTTMETSEDTTQQIRNTIESMGAGLSVVHVETLSTLPHSFVSRVTVDDGTTLIFKRAGSEELASGMHKELVVNRDVLSKLPKKVGPTLLYNSDITTLPWLVFEDISVSHRPVSLGGPPSFRYIEKFVQALGKTHAQSWKLDLQGLFSNVRGDVLVTDGSEHVAPVLDDFLRTCETDRFPPRTFDLVKKIRDNIPRIVTLLTGPSVLIHGDAHYGNALYAEDALLIDWALAVIGPGEVDLCHALAMNLPRYFASEYEPVAIHQYVQTCSKFGWDIYEDEVLERYRMCLLLTVVVAVGMKTVAGMQDTVWSYMFTNAVHSAIDHDSLAYLG